jgi:hypothetical protein
MHSFFLCRQLKGEMEKKLSFRCPDDWIVHPDKFISTLAEVEGLTECGLLAEKYIPPVM